MTATSSPLHTVSLGSSSAGEPSDTSGSVAGGEAAATGRCKGCRYSEPANDALLLLCLHDKFMLGYDVQRPPSDAVIVEDKEGWGFRVGPDFGCVHFAPLRRA